MDVKDYVVVVFTLYGEWLRETWRPKNYFV